MENTNYPLQENIQSLVNGELDEATRQALLEQAQATPDIADQLAFSQSLALALRNRDLVAASAVLTQVIAEEGFPPPTAPGTGAGKWLAWTGAAVFALLLSTGAYFWADAQGYFPSASQKLSRSVVQPLENVLFLPTDGAGLADLQSGMAAYDAHRYTEAARSLEAYLSRRSDHAARVYLGVSRLLSGQAAQAVQPLADAAQSPEPPIREAALWYLALAQLENGKPQAARQALENLPPDGLYGPQAQALLKKLTQ